MTNKLIHVGLVVVLAAGCGGRSARSGGQQQFETVQEGSASGVTTTIHGPGETLPPITGTNADTTTAFALDPNAVAPGQPAPSTATDMSAYSTAPNTSGTPISTGVSPAPAAPTPAVNTQPEPSQPATRPVPSTASRPRRVEPAPQPVPEDQPETDTSTTTVAPKPPPATTTTAAPPPPETDTDAEEPPPPTTSTDGLD